MAGTFASGLGEEKGIMVWKAISNHLGLKTLEPVSAVVKYGQFHNNTYSRTKMEDPFAGVSEIHLEG